MIRRPTLNPRLHMGVGAGVVRFDDTRTSLYGLFFNANETIFLTPGIHTPSIFDVSGTEDLFNHRVQRNTLPRLDPHLPRLRLPVPDQDDTQAQAARPVGPVASKAGSTELAGPLRTFG